MGISGEVDEQGCLPFVSMVVPHSRQVTDFGC